MDGRRYATFTVDGMRFAVDVAEVQEVIRSQPMTAVPRAPTIVAGLINLRGQIVTAVDLRRRLELPPRPSGRPPMNVVLRTAGGAVSLLVDEIGDVVDVGAGTLEPAPASLRGVACELILGVHVLAGSLLLVLDARRAIRPGTPSPGVPVPA